MFKKQIPTSDIVENKIIPIAIESEMSQAYVDYALSVIVARAIPDARDGLKPVHRRVLYGCLGLDLFNNKPFKKSARIVGEVLGKYYPHNGETLYEVLVRMAQEWSLGYTLIEGQGNFGSIDGDRAAAMRYTEARLSKIAKEMLDDIDKECVDFKPNFDNSTVEPCVLPSKLPSLLINGSSGIAVGMATNMAPHNLAEVAGAIIAYIKNNEITINELIQYIPAPDFPTGGIIYGVDGAHKAYHTGKGRVTHRAKCAVETKSNGRAQIVVTEIPYQVNKSTLIQKTAELASDKKIKGISNIRDESDRHGIRIVYELSKEAIPNVVLNNLYKHTELQHSFSINNVALVNGRPELLNLKQLIVCHVAHRDEVITRRTQFEHKQATKRLHILEGYIIALENIDPIVKLIRSSKDPGEARELLMTQFTLSDLQAKAILDLRLQRLTSMEVEKVKAEHKEITQRISELEEILEYKAVRMKMIQEELQYLQKRYPVARRSEIIKTASLFSIEDTIPNKPMVVTLSNDGYIKRTPLKEYNLQHRGGIGSRGAANKKEDFTAQLFVAHTHDHLLLFTEAGRIFWKRVYELPEGGKTIQGRAIQNLIEITDDKVCTILPVSKLQEDAIQKDTYLLFATRKGVVKKTALSAYAKPLRKGKKALLIKDGDSLLDVKLTNDNENIILSLKSGNAIRFLANTLRPMGRVSTGVKGVTLANKEDQVVSLITSTSDQEQNTTLLVVTENGYGKRSKLENYRITQRGGKGIKTLKTTEKTGRVVALRAVKEQDELMIVNQSGIIVRQEVHDIPTTSRATQGVRVIRLRERDKIADVAVIRRKLMSEVEAKDQQ